MTSTAITPPPTPPGPPGGDADDLSEFGYDQQLHRSLGKFASFAAGFSFVSILTTIFQLFGLGFGFGGPAFFWTWPIVYAGQFLVALCFAEIAARYPISGAIYQWSRRMGGEVIGWFGGWFMMIAQIVTASAAAIALQVVLPSIWSGFQVIGDDPTLTSTSGAANAVLLGSILLVIVTAINCVGISWMSRINNIGVTCELVGVVAVVLALFTHAQRGPDVVFDTGIPGQQPGYIWAFIVSGLMAAYVMVGFGSAGELAEETRNPRRVAPRTIRLALTVSAIGGGLMLLGALMAAPTLDEQLAIGGLPYVLDSVLGSFWGKVLLCDVAVAIFICTLAIQTACSRLMFSMARDGRLPFSKTLSHVNARTGTPIAPAILIGVLCVGILLVNVGNSAIFATLASVCIILIYLAYLAVTGPMLYRRFQGWPTDRAAVDAEGKKLFTMGWFGIVVNLLAVVYGTLMVINLAWPRAEVFDPAGDMPILRWAGPICIAITVLVGIACFPRGKEHPKPVTSPTADRAAAGR
ncbi:amino acid permease [Gordonia sp. HNM0687]|uniref:Amino acid permease n=1 Tax=Gordonia mangrovi TaxID=2665643 RepID=A0A6L7GPA6_9ACTN|nr:amino acid permease [Gordonia mangrovi]MXP20378.1 amino acid permease [Gordonia mangrovi]UVF79023.1 amino acid permease [Gordonia mangrovi]